MNPSSSLLPTFPYRNWAELSPDVLFLIFNKIGPVEILMRAQFVCKAWRQLSLEPAVWKKVDIYIRWDDSEAANWKEMAQEAVHRSQGQLEEFCARHYVSNQFLAFLADRATHLRCLHLISAYYITNNGLVEAISRLPFLEELGITYGSLYGDICKSVGQACPQLKSFRLDTGGGWCNQYDREALGVANYMPELRELQLIGNDLTDEGLEAILDKCVHLESLDLRCCFKAHFTASMLAKCTRIKNLRLPHDPMDDYGPFDDDGMSYGSIID